MAEAIIDHLISGVDLRPGAALAQFGIGWVVVLPGADLDRQALDRQIDLSLTPVDPELIVYENLADSARAVTDDGAVWAWEGQTYRGDPTDGRVRLADNADARWGPDWAPDDGWANTVSGTDGQAVFTPDSLTRVAGLASGVLLLVLLLLIGWGTRTPAKRKPANARQVPAESDAVAKRDVEDGSAPVGMRS